MRNALLPLVVGAGFAALSAPALAQSSATGADPVVTGDNRVTCRRVTRTATRMRVGRVCRSQSQWAREAAPGPVPSDPNGTIDGAADSIETSGDKLSTGDIGTALGSEGVTGTGPY
jgi:hypothetical protein